MSIAHPVFIWAWLSIGPDPSFGAWFQMRQDAYDVERCAQIIEAARIAHPGDILRCSEVEPTDMIGKEGK